MIKASILKRSRSLQRQRRLWRVRNKGEGSAERPRLVVSLISPDEVEQTQFWQQVHSPFVGDNHTRWVDGQFALSKPELGLSNWANGRLFGRGAILTGDGVYTVRTRYVQQ